MLHLLSRKILVIAALLLGASGLYALEHSTPKGKIAWLDDSGVIQWTLADGTTLEFLPRVVEGTEDALEATVIPGRDNAQGIYLRGKNFGLGFFLDGKTGNLRVGGGNWNAAFKLKTAMAAVVLPDGFAEDILLEKAASPRRIPGCVPFFLALLDGEQATVGVIPFKHTGNVTLAADLQTMDFLPGLQEEYTFVPTTGKQVWHKVPETITPTPQRTPIAWKPPFSARFRAAYPVKTGFFPAGDNLHYIWNCIIERPGTQKPYIILRPPRLSVVDSKSYTMWCSGFDGTFGYPFVIFLDGQAKMRYSGHAGKRFAYDKTRPIYIYAYDNGGLKDAPRLPQEFLSTEGVSQMVNNRNSSVGIGPATCHLTSNVIEKIFYRSEAREKNADLRVAILKTQLFVESVRSRIETYRQWAEKTRLSIGELEKRQADTTGRLAKCKEALAYMETLYQEALPAMQQPADARKLQEALLRDVDNAALDDEALEEKAKEFGRRTRTIGGAQDTLMAKCRAIAKAVRQNAVLALTEEQPEAVQLFWEALYAQTTRLMQDYFDHEGK